MKKGTKHTDESKAKMREALIGRTSQLIGRYGITEEIYQKAKELGLQWCRDCKQFLPPEFFHSEFKRKKGRGKRCIECNKKRVQEWRDRLSPSERRRRADHFKEWRKEHADYAPTRRLARMGVTREWHESRMEEQGGKCAICGKAEKELKRKLCIDHNHKTNELRGLLCIRCNAFISGIEDNLLDPALEYLKKYE